RADDDIGNTALASAIVLAVKCREPFNQKPAKFSFTAHEYSLPGDENVFEDHEGLSSDHAKLAVAGVYTALELPFLVRLTAEDHRDAGSIEGYGRNYSVSLVAFAH